MSIPISTTAITCPPPSSTASFALSVFVCAGVVVSYLPQLLRIIAARSSQGFSAYFLLLGASSSSLSFLNALVLHLPFFHCPFSVHIALLQVGLQWSMFTILCVLFLSYYPTARDHPNFKSALHILSVTALCVLAITIGTAVVLTSLRSKPNLIAAWNTLLGVGSAGFSAAQYLPQIHHTLRTRRPASLSIPMMCIQAPGSFVFVLALSLQPAVDWTTCLAFLVTGCLQSALLVICITFHVDLRRHGLDDWGNPLHPDSEGQTASESSPLLSSD